MAHNLNFNNRTGQHAFFSVKEKAWHGLGRVVTDRPTSAEAIAFAGLDFTVEKRKLFTYDNQNLFGNADTIAPTLAVPGHYATVRTDLEEVLGVVGKEYEVVQNRDAFAFFDALVAGEGLPPAEAGIQYETAGALGKGERIFITAKLPGFIRVGGEDLIEKYLFLTTSHDGFGSITAAFTPVRIVCNNTLNAALKDCSGTVRIRHTTGAAERLAQAHKVLGLSRRLSTQLETVYNRWARVPVTDRAVQKLIRLALAPSKEVLRRLSAEEAGAMSARFTHQCEAVFAYAQSSPSQQTPTTKGTLFGAYNAVTGYFQNVKGYKTEEAKLRSLLYGGTAQARTQTAFALCERYESGGEAALHLN